MNKGDTDESFERSIAYLHGRIENQIETFAIALGCSAEFLATRISALLRPGGEGAQNQVPGVSRTATEVRSTTRALEVVKRSPRNKTQVKKSRGPKGYWAKMTPEQRSAEMNRRHQVALKRKKAAA